MRYLWVTALINAGQAVLVGLAFWWLGMPAPLLWAILTFVLEFIPYLGATVMIALIAVVAFGAFEDLGRILMAPGSYLIVTTIQNNLVSPYLYGQHLKLNPVAVLVGVLIWWFLWGIPGAFLAVPIIATIKIVADRVEGFGPVGEFLGE
jgi:predicted PurR-regulated permease PerM